MDGPEIRILRLSRTALITGGDVFENNFLGSLGFFCDVVSRLHQDWMEEVLGPIENAFPMSKAIEDFSESVKGFDYVSPNYELNTISPFLMYLRNRSRSSVRLLMIAHSPGIYLLEWALLSHVLVPGDWIIAPSHNAQSMIVSLCPDLAPFVRVIPHPIPTQGTPKPAGFKNDKPVFASLARINGDKLIHRQIEALAILGEWGHPIPQLQIAGSLGGETPTPYVRCLKAKVARLGLQDHVEFMGPINDIAAKTAWLARAEVLINLSVTIEESFGKAPGEALTLGVPVLSTKWNGLTETVGKGGTCVEVTITDDFMPDVTAESVARAMIDLLENPPSTAVCIAEAKRFDPRRVGQIYCDTLRQGLDLVQPDVALPNPEMNHRVVAPERGLFSQWVGLKAFSVAELFQSHLDHVPLLRRVLVGEMQVPEHREMSYRVIIMRGSLYPLACFLSGNRLPEPTPGRRELAGPMDEIGQKPVSEGFSSRLLRAAELSGDASSRVSCLFNLFEAGQFESLEKGLDCLEEAGINGPGYRYLRVEFLLAKRYFSEAYKLCVQSMNSKELRETQATQIRQLAKVCRNWRKPEKAIPWLRDWLNEYPDSPDSGAIWLVLGFMASRLDHSYRACALKALNQAKTLLGNVPVVEKLDRIIKSQ